MKSELGTLYPIYRLTQVQMLALPLIGWVMCLNYWTSLSLSFITYKAGIMLELFSRGED